MLGFQPHQTGMPIPTHLKVEKFPFLTFLHQQARTRVLAFFCRTLCTSADIVLVLESLVAHHHIRLRCAKTFPEPRNVSVPEGKRYQSMAYQNCVISTKFLLRQYSMVLLFPEAHLVARVTVDNSTKQNSLSSSFIVQV